MSFNRAGETIPYFIAATALTAHLLYSANGPRESRGNVPTNGKRFDYDYLSFGCSNRAEKRSKRPNLKTDSAAGSYPVSREIGQVYEMNREGTGSRKTYEKKPSGSERSFRRENIPRDSSKNSIGRSLEGFFPTEVRRNVRVRDWHSPITQIRSRTSCREFLPELATSFLPVLASVLLESSRGTGGAYEWVEDRVSTVNSCGRTVAS